MYLVCESKHIIKGIGKQASNTSSFLASTVASALASCFGERIYGEEEGPANGLYCDHGTTTFPAACSFQFKPSVQHILTTHACKVSPEPLNHVNS